ncbi:MAG: hypothetical protein E7653_02160 [Ruminococcaceae bacterium]|nr:hypothetical protein [Oscillospiraceae bacterium]
MARIFTEEEFYTVYKSRVKIYSDALYYDSTSKGYDLYQAYYSATHELQRYLVQKHIGEGFTEVMAYNMYNLLTGGPLKPPKTYEYINADRYPELGRMHREAEAAREKYNIFVWNRLVSYIDRCYEVRKRLEWNAVKPEYLQAAKDFVAMEDRLTEIKEKEYWGYGENTKKYDEEQEKKKQKYENDFAAAHPGYKQECDDAYREGHYGWEKGKNLRKVQEKYGFKEFEKEEDVIRRLKTIYYDIIEDLERQVYQKQKSLGNLENYTRAVIRAVKDNYPRFTDEECLDYWKRHFDISLSIPTEKKVQTVSAPKVKPAAPKKTVKAAEPKPVAAPKPVIPTPEEIKKSCRIGSKGKLFEYFGDADYVTLPSGITEISALAFESVKPRLRGVVLPEGFWWLNLNTFADCPKLEEVILPKSLTGIGERAFANCPMLKTISIPSGILNIAEHAFEGCVGLKSVELPDDCLYFDSSFPKTCKIKLIPAASAAQPTNTVSVSQPTSTVPTEDASFKIENKICKKYLGSEEHVVIPDGVTKIGSSSFGKARSFLKSVVIPEGVTEIASLAFCECKKLERVTLPSSLRIIKNQAFYGCPALTEICLPEGVTSIDGYAFGACPNLGTVSIPSTVQEIAPNAFSGCDKLREVVVPYALRTSDVSNAFPLSCNVKFAKLTTTGQRTTTTGSVATDNASFEIEDGICRKYKGKSTDVIIPDGVIKIDPSTFIKARGFLKSVVVPEGVTEIDTSTFLGCEKLESVTLPTSLRVINKLAFDHCTALTEIYLPEGVKEIGVCSFFGCENLKTVRIPSTVREITPYAFSGCDKLTEVVVPHTLKSADLSNAFPPNCKVTFVDKKTIAQQAQTRSTATAASAPIPKSDVSAHNNVEKYCKMSGNSLIGFTGDMDYVVLPDSVKEIYGFAFDDVKKSLRVVVIPEGVTEIPEKTFKDCTNLEEIRLPSSLKKIGPWAFGYCKNLKNITFPNGIINIAANAFEGCHSLTEVSVPSGCYYNKNRRMASFPQNCKVNMI